MQTPLREFSTGLKYPYEQPAVAGSNPAISSRISVTAVAEIFDFQESFFMERKTLHCDILWHGRY